MGSSDTSLATLVLKGPGKSLRELGEPPRSPNKDRDPREYFALLLRRKWLILTVVVVSTVGVALYALSLPSIFESTATIQAGYERCR